MVGADQAEVAWVLSVEEVDLLILSWSLLARRDLQRQPKHALTRLLRNFFGRLLDAIGHSGSLRHVGGSCRLLPVQYAFGGGVKDCCLG
jgi:hypothetical protein